MTIADRAAAGIVIGWLPGAVVFRAPLLDRERRAALDAVERIFWQVLISVALSLSAVLALAAVGRYSFERLLIVDAALLDAELPRRRPFPAAAGLRRAAAWLAGARADRARRCSASGASSRRPSTSSAARIPASTSTKGYRSRSAARSSAPTRWSPRFRTSRAICSSLRSSVRTITAAGSWGSSSRSRSRVMSSVSFRISSPPRLRSATGSTG